jgi:hypothetical protein
VAAEATLEVVEFTLEAVQVALEVAEVISAADILKDAKFGGGARYFDGGQHFGAGRHFRANHLPAFHHHGAVHRFAGRSRVVGGSYFGYQGNHFARVISGTERFTIFIPDGDTRVPGGSGATAATVTSLMSALIGGDTERTGITAARAITAFIEEGNSAAALFARSRDCRQA